MLRDALMLFLASAVFGVLEIASMVVVYMLCRLLIAIGMKDWVFPVWLVGIPLGLLGAVVATIIVQRFVFERIKRYQP